MNEQLLVTLVGLSDWAKKTDRRKPCRGIQQLRTFCNTSDGYNMPECAHCPLLQVHGKKSYWTPMYKIILSTKK